MATKKQRRDEDILRHGFALQRTFPQAEYGPVELCRKLIRIERRMNRHNEALCNGEIEGSQHDKLEARALDDVDALIGFREAGIPVFINSDPRGCALKIDDIWMRSHRDCDLPQDWGGYGLIAPEIE